MINRITGLAAALLVAGCAGTNVEPIAFAPTGQTATAGIKDADAKGLRYYEGAHFLIVYTDGKGGLKSEVRFLPDVTQKRSIDPYAYFAKNETTLTFSNGMLTQSKAVIDETILPKSAIAALEKVAVQAIMSANQTEGEPLTYLPFPKLYKIVISADGKLGLLPGQTTVEGGAKGVYVTVPTDGGGS